MDSTRIKCSAYLGVSVDGFIARRDGDIEWLHAFAPMGDGGLSYEDFIATVDLVVMGRHSYEKVLTFGEWPYRLPVLVLSSRKLELPEDLRGKVSRDAGAPRELVDRLASEGHRHLYVDGGDTIQRFLEAGLIDEITITWVPVLLGDGISLFGALDADLPLRHLETTTFDNGFVQTRYQPMYGGSRS